MENISNYTRSWLRNSSQADNGELSLKKAMLETVHGSAARPGAAQKWHVNKDNTCWKKCR